MLTTRIAEVTPASPASRRSDGCPQCQGRIIDVGEELVCSSCGVVAPKEVQEERGAKMLMLQPIEYSSHALGSFLGPAQVGFEEMFSRGFSKSSSTFRYLKTISDHSYRHEDGSLQTCIRLIERVCEKLALPRAVAGEAVNIAREVMAVRDEGAGFTIASVSAFSVINSCKIRGVTSVGVKTVVETHRDLGYRIKASSIIQVSIDSPVRMRARRAEDYLGTVLARLPSVPLSGGGKIPAGYLNRLGRNARLALESVDGPSRGGHNPRALAATAIYAAEMAIAMIEERKRILSQKDVAVCADAAEYTVREQYVEIFKDRIEAICALIKSKEIQTQPSSSRMHQIPLQPARLS